MSTYIPAAVQDALRQAQNAEMKQKNRLRVQMEDKVFPILHMWQDGFAVEVGTVPPLRGLVDLYEGSRHLSQCLIVAADEEHGEMRYDFKRATAATEQPPVDFYRAPDAPAGLLPTW